MMTTKRKTMMKMTIRTKTSTQTLLLPSWRMRTAERTKTRMTRMTGTMSSRPLMKRLLTCSKKTSMPGMMMRTITTRTTLTMTMLTWTETMGKMVSSSLARVWLMAQLENIST